MKTKTDQNVIDEHKKLRSLHNLVSILHETESCIEHDAFIKAASELIAPGSLGMISDDYRFLCRGYGIHHPYRITEITRQGNIYLALSYVPQEHRYEGPWIGNSRNSLDIASDEDISKRAREIAKYFKIGNFSIVTSRYRKSK